MPIEREKLDKGQQVITDKSSISVKRRVECFLRGETDPLTNESWPDKLKMTQQEIIDSGWTQQEIAERLHVNEQQVNQAIMSGKKSLYATGVVKRRIVKADKRTKIYNTVSGKL